jgi:predicted transcriptional regulator
MAQISKSENVIMDIIWQNNDSMSPNEVIKKLPQEYSWKYKTVATFLTRLTEKGILICEKQSNFNVYTPKISKQEYIETETRLFLEQYHNGSVSNMIAALYKNDIDKEKLNDLFALIEREG